MVEFELRQKDLVPVFKTESIVSAVLSGQRQLTAAHIRKLADFFHISPAAFFSQSRDNEVWMVALLPSLGLMQGVDIFNNLYPTIRN